ncbi:Nuclear transport factor 2 [Coemansia spiralis]|nr:Nuclear transport factor 2 [Coemansia spiralis]
MQSAEPPSEQRITQATNQGEKFADRYYQSFGSAGRFYTDASKVIWSGTPFLGANFKSTVLPELQKYYSQFEVNALDVHPLDSNAVAVCVAGTVCADREKSQFSQQFVLCKDNGLTYIVSDCFRLV